MMSGSAGTVRTRHRIALAALMLTVAAVFWRHLLSADVLFYRDISYIHFARAVELRTIVRSGAVPLWNPFEHFGEPVAANPNYLLFYPTTWLAWVLPVTYGFKLHYVLHFFALAAGSFLLARRAGLGPLACYAAGALFVFSGPVMSLGNFANFLPAAAWMPFAILATDRLMRRGGVGAAALCGACFAAQIFAGEPLTSIATVLLALGWSLTFHGDRRAGPLARANRVVVGRLLGSLVLAAGFSAVQVLPALWHARHTERAQFSYESTFVWSLHPLRLLEVLIPGLWGNPVTPPPQPWGGLEGRDPFLLSVALGIAPLAFALLAILARATSSSVARGATRFWTLATVAAFVLALGRHTPLSYVFYYALPLFRVVRFPSKFMVAAALGVAQLAAIGVEDLAEAAGGGADRPSRARRWLSLALLALGVLWLVVWILVLAWPAPAHQVASWLAALESDAAQAARLGPWLRLGHAEIVARAASWLLAAVPAHLPYVVGTTFLLAAVMSGATPRPLAGPALLVAVVAGIAPLVFAHVSLNPLADRRYFATTPPVLSYLESARPPLRIFAEPLVNLPGLPPVALQVDLRQVDFLPPAAHAFYIQRLSLGVAAGLLGIESTFTADIERLLLSPQHLVNSLVCEQGVFGDPLARLLRVSSVDYALLRRWPPGDGLEPVGVAPNATTLPVQVYRVRDSLPRVHLAAEAVFLPVGASTIERLLSPGFDPVRQVVLEPRTTAPASTPEPLTGQATLLSRDALRVEVAATTSAPSYLVLTDSYTPDWQVEVNGHRGELLRADQMFRGVALPPGSHRVIFRYRPPSVLWGAAISLATALAGAALRVFPGRPRSSTR